MSEHDHGTCRQLLKDLSSYVDGELEEGLCREIEQHMAACDNCRVVVDTLRTTILLYHCLPADPLPDEVEGRLFRRLQLNEYLQTS